MSVAAGLGGLKPRNALLAALLALLSPGVGFAYVRRFALGLAWLLLTLAVLFVGGRLGLPGTPTGFYVLVGLGVATMLIGAVLAFRIARTTPVDAPARWYNRWYHYLWIGVAAMTINYLISESRGLIFGFESHYIPSVSMQPTLTAGDYIVVDTRAETLASIQRGDVVTYTPRDGYGPVRIARVVGLPGERIDASNHRVIIDGRALDEPYLQFPDRGPAPAFQFTEATLGPDQFYLLGDNRPNSADSRLQGPFPRTAIVGKARHIWLSRPATGGISFTRVGTLVGAHAP